MNTPDQSPTEKDGTIHRRVIMQGAAWTVPIIATAAAAPLAAASNGCGPGTINWTSNYTRTDNRNASGTATTTGGGSVNYTHSVTTGPWVTDATNNLTPYTAVSPAHLNLNAAQGTPAQATTNWAQNDGYNITLRHTFNKPVTNVRFTIWDVDSAQSGSQFWTEYVRVVAPGVTRVLGSGLAAQPNGWVYPINWGDTPDGATSHAVTYTIPGPITSFDIQFSRPSSGVSGSGIGIGPMRFELPC